MSVFAAISSRHSNDLIVPECKDGPTHGGSHLRLDYWVLRRSWVNPAMIGYEVKSSRADWLSDKKWPMYLPLCNELWFIAEDLKAIPVGELPEGVGLLRLAGSRLITVKRAHWREVASPESLLTYILMCRARITREHETADSRLSYWREWLAKKDEGKGIGYDVSKRLRGIYSRDVEKVRSENERLQRENDALTSLRDALNAAGIKWHRWLSVDRVIQEIKATPWDRGNIQAAYETLGKLLNGKAQEEPPHE